MIGFLSQHWIGITWFLGWGLALWQAVENWFYKRRDRQIKAGATAIRLIAAYAPTFHFQTGYTLSESEAREILKKSKVDPLRVFAVMQELEEKGFATRDREGITPGIGGELRWTVK